LQGGHSVEPHFVEVFLVANNTIICCVISQRLMIQNIKHTKNEEESIVRLTKIYLKPLRLHNHSIEGVVV